jgi:hypothetical protein
MLQSTFGWIDLDFREREGIRFHQGFMHAGQQASGSRPEANGPPAAYTQKMRREQ